jgi:hypothetical protein
MIGDKLIIKNAQKIAAIIGIKGTNGVLKTLFTLELFFLKAIKDIETIK